ncbi:hypothetical protein H4R34_002152 [Dimargaris verticillata]|uniref:Magnesium transporter NIPA-domain-containing protein n=1 Tax=Dimargaris verticillata TaxID=2761393 RepID=A0A9W8EEC5_9FUNG|nr:hypothetical protein H4R34_002152 [Dimargaris verticillata]
MEAALREPSAHGGLLLLGIAISIGTSFLQSLGLTLQRKSHMLEAHRLPDQHRPSFRRPLWLLGFALFVASSFTGTTLTISLLPVIILAPLGAVTLIANAIFAKVILGDHFSPQAVLATVLVVLGGMLVGLFGAIPMPAHSLEDLIRLYRRPAFIIYFALLETVVIAGIIAGYVLKALVRTRLAQNEVPVTDQALLRRVSTASHQTTEPLRPRFCQNPTIPDSPPPAMTCHSPGASPVSVDRPESVSSASSATQTSPTLSLLWVNQWTALEVHKLQTMCGLLYGLVSGMLASQSLIFAKSGIELLLVTVLDHDNQFGSLLTWAIVGALIVTALLQLYYLNKGLELCDTLILSPMSFCSFNVFTLFNGLVYYDQLGSLHVYQLTLVVVGVLVLSTGVLILSLGGQPTKSDQDSSYVCISPRGEHFAPLSSVPSSASLASSLPPFSRRAFWAHWSMPWSKSRAQGGEQEPLLPDSPSF